MQTKFYYPLIKHFSLKKSFSLNTLKCKFSSITNTSTINTPTINTPTINTPNRIELNYFSGKMFGDKKWYDPQIQLYQKQVLHSISEKNDVYFTDIAFETKNYLETLFLTHPFYINEKKYKYNLDNHATIYRYLFRMSFWKSIYSATGLNPNNHSGYYLLGNQGVGKDDILRICCLISGILLPNFSSVYLNCKKISSETTLMDACIYATQDIYATQESNIKLKTNVLTIDSIRNQMRIKDKSIGLFINEGHFIYSKENWSTIHSLITNFTDAVFMSESIKSDSYLENIKNGNQQNEFLKQLNDTKITPLFIEKVNNENQCSTS